MKFDKAQSEVETVIPEDDFETNQEKDGIRFQCPNCSTTMVSMKENAVQCELLTPISQCALNNLLTVDNSRRGSVQSVTEVREDVGYDEGVSTSVESNQLPDEIVLVTRSFENEVQPPPPRRSSISQFFTNIKSLGTRHRSEPNLKRRFLEENDAAVAGGLRSGIRRNSTSMGLGVLNETNSDEDISDNQGLTFTMPQLKRHSIQMTNGQVVQEDIEECAGASAITMDDETVPGEINIVTRCFEMPENYAPRRESLIDKLNFVKMIGKNRKRKEKPERSVDDDEEEPTQRHAISGVRRKSIAPAALAGIGEGAYPQDKAVAVETPRAGLTAPDQADVAAARYVTSGIRRGSVAAVSAAPPCRAAAEEKDIQNGPTLKPEDDPEVRYVTSGIRRGSVAAVSAAPPCRMPTEESGSTLGMKLSETDELPNQQRRGSYERIETYHMDPESQDVLRSGVRRRSLVPAADGSLIASPATEPTYSYNPVANETIYTSGEDESDEETARKISSGSGENFKQRSEKPKSQRKKGVIDLFESLTGREADVNYEDIDANAMQQIKTDAEKKTSFDSSQIPQIMLSMDDTNYDELSEEHEDEKNNNQDEVDEVDENESVKTDAITSTNEINANINETRTFNKDQEITDEANKINSPSISEI